MQINLTNRYRHQGDEGMNREWGVRTHMKNILPHPAGPSEAPSLFCEVLPAFWIPNLSILHSNIALTWFKS